MTPARPARCENLARDFSGMKFFERIQSPFSLLHQTF